ncbi:uncharacterized protein LOC134819627 isoform X3 [Bolinopsis microptera]|uniref:uncharacterized protein LOC134819627 isoform X3 n=1 Tax=Bolinopsis microptera TaxID=2820187 RepID=UPI00307949BD
MSVKQVHIERSYYQSTTALDFKPSKKSAKDIYIELLDRALQALHFFREGKQSDAENETGKDIRLHASTTNNFSNVDLALEKVVQLHYHYHLNTKLMAGANNLLGAISSSPAGRVRTILNELSHEKHEARYKLNGLESEFKEFLGYLHIEPRSLIGHGRLCGGDVYEVTVKSGTQKIKTQCKIDSSLNQKWKDTQKSLNLKITYHEQITVKVIDKRKYERNINVGEVTFSLMNLLSVRPLNIIVALGTCTSLRLNFTLAWTPVVKGQQINFDPFGQLPFQDTVIGGLCQGFGGGLKHRATSLAQLQQLTINDPSCSVPKGLTSAVSMMSISEQPDQPLAALLQDTIILYEDFELQFSEVKDLLSALRQLRIDLHPAPAGTPQLSTGTMSSAASSQDNGGYFGSVDNVSSVHSSPAPYPNSVTRLNISSLALNDSPSNSPSNRETKWISESMRPRNRKKSIFSSVRQKKYKRYNVPVGPLFNNYDQTLKKTRLTSRCAQVDRFLAIHLQYLQDVCSNLQCSYLLKTRQQSTLEVVREHCAMFLRVRDYIRDRPELIAVTLEPLLLEDRWRGLWNVLSEDKFCTITYDKLYSKLSSHYGHMLQDTPDEMFKYMIQCITDSVNSKYNDVNTATVCQVIRYFKERSTNGVGRFIRQFSQEYGIVHGLRAHLLRDREDAVQRFQNLSVSGTKFRIAMCMLGSSRSEAVALTSSTFTEVKNSESMRQLANHECCKGLEDVSPYIRHCACLAIDMLNVTDSVQLLQRIAGVDLSHIRHAAVKVLERWGLKEDPLKEGVHPYLSVKLDPDLRTEDVLHFSLKIPTTTTL